MLLADDKPTFAELAIAAITTLTITVWCYYKWRFDYWRRAGVFSDDVRIPMGNATKLATCNHSFGDLVIERYNCFKKKGVKHGGFYLGTQPFYMPIDPQIMRSMTIQDFAHFANHGGYFNEADDPLSGHLFNLENSKWKNMRAKLTPGFSSGKMKMMFKTLWNCASELKVILKEGAETGTPVEIKDIMARYTTDVIGSIAFGLECNSLKDPDAQFRIYGRKIFDVSLWDMMKLLTQNFLSVPLLRFLKFRLTKQDVEDFFLHTVYETVRYRETNNVYRKDFMHLLLQLKNRGEVTDDTDIKGEISGEQKGFLTLNELAAQAFVFFMAGFETSSTTMTFVLLELAKNPQVQDKLRKEINSVLAKYNEELAYDAIGEMTYLEQVLSEALRKYPPLPFLPRICTKDYKVPDSDVTVKKGTYAFIPVLGMHNDPEYYPDPEVFDPERFTTENIQKRPNGTWIPFGQGPRACIGLRLGKLQSKVGLVTLISNYKFTVNEKTQLPPKFQSSSITLSVDGGVWLNAEAIQK